MKRLLSLLFLVNGFGFAAYSQSLVTNFFIEQAGGEFVIRYDLQSQINRGYYVKLFLVNDSLSRTVQLTQLTGDVNNVQPGGGKTIKWNPGSSQGLGFTKARFQIDVYRVPDNLTNMVYVEGGSYLMGSENGGDDAIPLHPVTVSNFYLGVTEVTIKEYRLFCKEANYPLPEPTLSPEEEHPITFVNWYDSNAYLDWLSKKSGINYRLPTEAEWEFAARGGTQTNNLDYSGSNNINDVGWYNQNSLGSMHHPVGKLKPNNLGLFDMTGNVWEWCQDWYNSKFYSVSPSQDPAGPAIGKVKVGRGGSWYNKAVPVGFRYFLTPQSKTNYVGFRVALSASKNPPVLVGSGISAVVNIESRSAQALPKAKNTEPPIIQVINPVVERGQMISYYGAEVKVKGKVAAKTNLLLFLVNGMETPVDENGYFEQRVSLKYLENEIQIRAIDADRNVGSVTFTINRELNQAEVERKSTQVRGVNYALLVGTNNYKEFPTLSNPVFDVNMIAKELEQSFGFEVKTLIDPTLEEFYSMLRSYGSRKYSSIDQLFIFVAGHGIFDDVFGDGYLVLADSRKEDLNKTSYISHSNLRTILNNIDCAHIFLVLDVCFGGTFDPIVASRGDEYEAMNRDQFITKKLQYRTRQYLTSGGKTYVSDGRPGSHSPFAREFIRALRGMGGADRVLTINEIIGFVEKVQPEPRRGEFGTNEPGSDFLFISRE